MATSDSQNSRAVDAHDGFNKLLLLLDADRDRAGGKYEELRRRLLFYFQIRGCLIPEELVDRTISRVTGKVAAGEKIISIEGYWFGVAYYILKEHWAAQGREIPELADLPASREPFIDPIAAERDREADRLADRKHECMLRCLQSLPADQRELVSEYCAKGEREGIARRLKTTVNTLRVRVHRIRAKLNKCLEACLRDLAASEI